MKKRRGRAVASAVKVSVGFSHSRGDDLTISCIQSAVPCSSLQFPAVPCARRCSANISMPTLPMISRHVLKIATAC